MAYRLFKVLHILGLAAFLGSIFGHIVSSILGGEVGGTAAFLNAREHIAFATKVLTLPGLYLTLASGIAMMLTARLNPLRQRWLLPHAGLGLVILAVSLVIIGPAVGDALVGTQELVRGTGDLSRVAFAKKTEDMFGGLNVLAAVAAMVLVVWKPRLGKTTG